MREIKFRAWDKLRKMMLNDVSAIHFDSSKSGVEQVYATNTSKESGLNWHPQDCIELMQYTGLKDKNGKEIYEGDIMVKNEHGEINTIEMRFDCHKVGDFLNWEIYGFRDYSKGTYDKTVEVIGNIYENPELLKNRKDL